ncbi:hypothetical protein ACLKA6_007549 [Drosophila palustris]
MSTETFIELDYDENLEFRHYLKNDVGRHSVNKALDIVRNEMVTANLSNYILNRKNTDIVFKHAKIIDNCHSDVLRYHSLYFKRNLPTGAVINLPIQFIHPTAFKFLYDWMIRGSIECPQTKLLELLEAGFKLYMPILVTCIFECMDDKNTFTVGHAIDVYFRAMEKKMLGIADVVLACVRKYFLLMVDTVEFSQIEASCLCRLLNSDHLGVQSEIEVFYAIFIWLYVDFEARKTKLNRVLRSLRFKLLPSKFLSNIGVHIHEIDPELANNFHSIMQVTMWMHQTLKMEHGIEDNIKPTERIWIKDPECPYEQKDHISHIEFMQYVKSLKTAETFLARLKETETEETDKTDETEGVDETEAIDESGESDTTLDASSTNSGTETS